MKPWAEVGGLTCSAVLRRLCGAQSNGYLRGGLKSPKWLAERWEREPPGERVRNPAGAKRKRSRTF